MLTCKQCPGEKPESDFYPKASMKTGYDNLCKKCRGKKSKARRDKSPRPELYRQTFNEASFLTLFVGHSPNPLALYF